MKKIFDNEGCKVKVELINAKIGEQLSRPGEVELDMLGFNVYNLQVGDVLIKGIPVLDRKRILSLVSFRKYLIRSQNSQQQPVEEAYRDFMDYMILRMAYWLGGWRIPLIAMALTRQLTRAGARLKVQANPQLLEIVARDVNRVVSETFQPNEPGAIAETEKLFRKLRDVASQFNSMEPVYEEDEDEEGEKKNTFVVTPEMVDRAIESRSLVPTMYEVIEHTAPHLLSQYVAATRELGDVLPEHVLDDLGAREATELDELALEELLEGDDDSDLDFGVEELTADEVRHYLAQVIPLVDEFKVAPSKIKKAKKIGAKLHERAAEQVDEIKDEVTKLLNGKQFAEFIGGLKSGKLNVKLLKPRVLKTLHMKLLSIIGEVNHQLDAWLEEAPSDRPKNRDTDQYVRNKLKGIVSLTLRYLISDQIIKDKSLSSFSTKYGVSPATLAKWVAGAFSVDVLPPWIVTGKLYP
jgi:hypothetical protein